MKSFAISLFALAVVATTSHAAPPEIVVLESAKGILGEGTSIPFGVFDPDGDSLTVAVTTGDQRMIAIDALRLEGDGDERSIVIDKILAPGKVVLSVVAFDGEATTTRQVTVNVDGEVKE